MALRASSSPTRRTAGGRGTDLREREMRIATAFGLAMTPRGVRSATGVPAGMAGRLPALHPRTGVPVGRWPLTRHHRPLRDRTAGGRGTDLRGREMRIATAFGLAMTPRGVRTETEA